MIEKLWVKNYRSLKDVCVEFGKITVLVGLNGSGKSTLIDVLHFVSDALLLGLDSAIFKRQGISMLRLRSTNGQVVDVEIGLSIRSEEFNAQYHFALGSLAPSRGVDEYYVKSEVCVVEKNGQRSEFKTNDGQWLSKPAAIYPQIQRHRLLLPLMTAIEPYQEVYNVLKGMSFYNIWPAALREPQKFINPYPLQSDGGNFAAALFEFQRRESTQIDHLKSALNFVLFDIDDYRIEVVGSHLVVKLHYDIDISGAADTNGQSPWFELAQESEGTLRMLGILMALYQEPLRTLIAIEEPELTVHSYIMNRLWEEIEEASERGSQIILTTHSPDFLDLCSVQQLRVVEKIDGITYVGLLEETQKQLALEERFALGQVLKSLGTLNRATEG